MARVHVRSLLVRLLLLPVVVLLLVSACACAASPTRVSATTPTTAVSPAAVLPTAAPPTPNAATLPTCQSSQLAAVVASGGAGLGHALAYVWVLNRNVTPCTLVGYARVELLDGQQRPLATHQQEVTTAYLFLNLQPQVVVLAGGGGRAVFLLQSPDGPINNAQTCPVVAYLRVTLPGTQAVLVTAAQMAPCGGNVITSPLVAPAELPSSPA